MRSLFVATILFMASTIMAQANCMCTCVNGQPEALCSSTMDLPPICSPQICPIMSPSIAPIPQPYLPPLGTSSCYNQQVLNTYTNQYEWRQVCR